MPNVHLTEQMETYVRGQISSGAYANLSEVVRAGIRLLMERDGARQFYALKADLEDAVREAEAGGFEDFDPLRYEPDADGR
ncbi:MAG: type II toxin-antitoxin system ParD family antitoxin [Defluviicoccus sp.]|nr:type II toxin-antitoxin system ParD family antitoxin [Defluviicoccus sp.]